MQTTANPAETWIAEPWELRQYTTGEWGIIHTDPAGDVQHVAIGVDPDTASALLAAPVFYRAGIAQRALAAHLQGHAGCGQQGGGPSGSGPCAQYVLAAAQAGQIMTEAMMVAERNARDAAAGKTAIPDPRLQAPTPPDPEDMAFQTRRIFQIPGGQAGMRDLAASFVSETGATIEEIEPTPAPAAIEPAAAPPPAAQPTEPRAPIVIDYSDPATLEGRPPSPQERALLDAFDVPGRPLQVIERGDHRHALTAAQCLVVVELVQRGSLSGTAVREDDHLYWYSRGEGGAITPQVLNPDQPIDAAAEGRCPDCRRLPGFEHLAGCPRDGQP